ncbi:hypothetical protein [Sulfobacillus harzensis]|uniref:DUF1640 domain-containing protein n=1 Tax=Sulfobacillus harzensis TaxID=2729629 RepID=A0A7Y0L868_9FIRM|nr:hypothetical protein [Sulfobacillus harzensis]NMP25094.1 hypothetical protein [Sulfobacillus harzensis]
MSDQPPTPPTTQDFPDHWGFYLLQAINRLDDKIDGVRREQERTADALRQELGQEISIVRQELGQEISTVRQELGHGLGGLRQEMQALDAKFDQKLTNLQYWYWGTLVVIIVGFVTILLTHP